MENFGVRKVIPPRFPIFERTSSPPSKNPKAPGTSGIGDSQKNRYLDSVVVGGEAVFGLLVDLEWSFLPEVQQ